MKQNSWTLSLYLSKEEIRHTLKTKVLTVRLQNSKVVIKVTVPFLKASVFHFDELLLKYRLKPYLHSSTSNLSFAAEKSHNHPHSSEELQAEYQANESRKKPKQNHEKTNTKNTPIKPDGHNLALDEL